MTAGWFKRGPGTGSKSTGQALDPSTQIRTQGIGANRAAPRFSIITVVRNNADGLRQAAESIRRQRFTDLEWIVVDRASREGFELPRSEPALTVVVSRRERDLGPYEAMNRGLDLARGQYLLFLDAGAALASAQTLADVDQVLTGNEIDLLYGDALEPRGAHYVRRTAHGHEFADQGMFASLQAMYFRRAFIGSQRFQASMRAAGDYEFASRLLARGASVQRLPMPLTVVETPTRRPSMRLRQWRGVENWRVQRDVLQVPWAERLRTRWRLLTGADTPDRPATPF